MKSKNKTFLLTPSLLSTVVAAALAMLSFVTAAQSPTSEQKANASEPASTENTTLPEVKINAATVPANSAEERGYRIQRSGASGFRQQAIIDTPFSITAISAEVIKDQQAKSLTDVVKNDPSVVQANDPLWYDRINLRGFYLGVDAVQRDGLSINDQGSIALENKAAIELAKGLSALRYGMTSPGGVVNYVVKRATNEPLAQVNLNANGFGGYGAHADFGGRFGANQQFGIRVNAASEDIKTHVDAVEGKKKFFSTFFDWQASDKLTIELDFEHQQRKMSAIDGPSISWYNSLAEARAAFPNLNADIYATAVWAQEPNEQNVYAARALYQINNQWRFKLAGQASRLSRDQVSINPQLVQPNGEYDAFLYYSPEQERNNNALQTVLEGDFNTGAFKHELAIGVDAIRRDMLYPDGFYGSIGSGNVFAPRPIARPSLVSDPSYLAYQNKNSSLFLTDTLSYSQWQLFGGLRYTKIKTFEGDASGVISKTYDDEVLNPSLGIVFKLLPTLSLYTSYAEGIEQGGIAPLDTVNQNDVLQPLKSKQYEAGIKYELAQGALLTAALFQINKGLEYINAANIYTQDGRQVHQGVEATISGPLSSSLRLIAGAAYLHARVKETENPALINKRPQGVPTLQANLFADYNASAWVPGLSANAGVYYGGKKAIDELNSWDASSYTRLDAGLRYQRAGLTKLDTYRLTVENLTDKQYLASTTFGALTFGAPRTIKASASFEF